MARSQRNKGAAYEREVCAALSAALGRPFKRHLGQARDGGYDIDAGALVVECKRRKTLTTVEGWLAQAARATPPDKTPLVVMRSDGGKSMVLMDMMQFLALFNATLRELVGSDG